MKLKNAKIGMAVVSLGMIGECVSGCRPIGTKGVIREIDENDSSMSLLIKWADRTDGWVSHKAVKAAETENSVEKENDMNIAEARMVAQRALTDENIKIEFDGYHTKATDIRTGKSGHAYCLREDRDNYDVAIGVAVAYNKVVKANTPKLYTATVYGLGEDECKQLKRECEHLGLDVYVEAEEE